MKRLLAVVLLSMAAAAATVEEVVAVVGSAPILASDLTLARLVALVEPDADEGEAAYAARLLETRVRLELQYRHLEETGVLYRLRFDPDLTADGLWRRLGPAAEADLHAAGLDRDDLDELAVRLAATTAYVEQRLRPRVRVSATQVEAEYRRLLDQDGALDSRPPPVEAADQVRRILVERELNAEIERWLGQAGERVEVTRFIR